MVRADVWINDTCLVCQSKHLGDAGKESHETEKDHCRKAIVYDFLSKELASFVPSTRKSVLFERYYRAGAFIPGLDCICELNFPSWSRSPLWACTICYVAGPNLDSVDAHLYSSHHRRTYISEYHPDRFTELGLDCLQSTEEKTQSLRREYETIVNLVYDAKGLAPPTVYSVNGQDREWTFEKLGLDSTEPPSEVIAESVSDYHHVVLCHICGEDYLADERDDLANEAWSVHLSTKRHQHCRFLHTLLQEVTQRQSEGLPKQCRVRAERAFIQRNGVFYGPTCGYEHLLMFKVPNAELTDHFSCETHIERYVRRENPSKLLNSQYLKMEERHEMLLGSLPTSGSHQSHQVSEIMLPTLLKRLSLDESGVWTSVAIEEVRIDSVKASWCQDCKEWVELPESDSWQMHVFDERHFDCTAKRALYSLDEEGMISKSISLVPFRRPNALAKWEERFSVALGVMQAQDYGEFALQFIVRDELGKRSICTCCYVVFGHENDEALSLHARTFDHSSRAIHSLNKKMVALLWKSKDVETKKKYLLEYIQHTKLSARSQMMSVYDPVLAFFLNCLTTIPSRLLELAKMAPHLRRAFLSSMAASSKASKEVAFNVALCATGVEIVSIGNNIITFRCQNCGQSYSCSLKRVEDSFADHLLSSSHWKREQLIKANYLDPNKRLPNTSSISVDSFPQPNSKKKVTWRWNEVLKSFEFVYATLGLADIAERRNFGSVKRDLFCTLCLESIKAAKADLQHHVRSFTHIFYYVNRHQPQSIADIEAVIMEPTTGVDKRKNARRLFARALKNSEKERGEIPIYSFTQQFICELPEVKLAIENEDGSILHPLQLADAMGTFTQPLDSRLRRTSNDMDTFLKSALDRCQIVMRSDATIGDATTLEATKEKFLAETDFDGFPVEDGDPTLPHQSAPVDGSKGQKRHLQKPSGSKSSLSEGKKKEAPASKKRGSSRSPSRTTLSRKPRSPSPTYKKFHAAPHGGYDFHARPAFYHLTNRDSIQFAERLGGMHSQRFPHPFRTSISPVRSAHTSASRAGADPPVKRRSRSPPQHKSRSKTPSRHRIHRSRSRGRERSPQPRTTTRSRSRSAARQRHHISVKLPRRGTEQRSRSRLSTTRHQSESAQPWQKMADKVKDTRGIETSICFISPSSLNSRSESPSLDDTPLVHRHANQRQDASKIPINIPSAPSVYRIRNAPAPVTVAKPSSPERTAKMSTQKTIHSAEKRQRRPLEDAEKEERQRRKSTINVGAGGGEAISTEKVEIKPRLPDAAVEVPSLFSKTPVMSFPPPPSREAQAVNVPVLDPLSLTLLSSLRASGLVPSTSAQAITLQAATATVDPPKKRDLLSSVLPSATTNVEASAPVPLSSIQLYPICFATPPPTIVKSVKIVPGVQPVLPFPTATVQPAALAPAASNPIVPSFVVHPYQQAATSFSFPTVSTSIPTQPTIVDHTELVMRAKMDLYSRDLHGVRSITELIEYLWKQGYDRIADTDPPLLFNEVVARRRRVVGASTLYQIICYGRPELETYYCGMCNHWTTVSEMFLHLTTSLHRLNYMYRSYRTYHRRAMEEQDENARDFLLEKFAEKINNSEGSGQVTNRMRCILNEEAIRRLWPEYEDYIDNSWKIMDDNDEFEKEMMRNKPEASQPTNLCATTAARKEGPQNRASISDTRSATLDSTNKPGGSQTSAIQAPGAETGMSRGTTVSKNPSLRGDDAALMRRAIGALAELQSMFEATGGMDAETVFKVCADMGVEVKDAVKHPLILQAVRVFGVDLEKVNLLRSSQMPPQNTPPLANSTISQANTGTGVQVETTQAEPQTKATTARLDLQSMGLSQQAIEEILSKISKSQQPPDAAKQAVASYSHAGYAQQAVSATKPPARGRACTAESSSGIPTMSEYPNYVSQLQSGSQHLYHEGMDPNGGGYSEYFVAGHPTSSQQFPTTIPPCTVNVPKHPSSKGSKPNANLEPLGYAHRLVPQCDAASITVPPANYLPSRTQREEYGRQPSPPVMARINYAKHGQPQASRLPQESASRQHGRNNKLAKEPAPLAQHPAWIIGTTGSHMGRSAQYDFTSDDIVGNLGPPQERLVHNKELKPQQQQKANEPRPPQSWDPNTIFTMANQIEDWSSLSSTMNALLGKKGS